MNQLNEKETSLDNKKNDSLSSFNSSQSSLFSLNEKISGL